MPSHVALTVSHGSVRLAKLCLLPVRRNEFASREKLACGGPPPKGPLHVEALVFETGGELLMKCAGQATQCLPRAYEFRSRDNRAHVLVSFDDTEVQALFGLN